MPSRRQFLGGIGTACAGGLAGCGTAGRTTTGVVERKQIDVGVRRPTDTTVSVTPAVLTYESDRRLVTGEYADSLPGVVEDGSLAVSTATHERLTDRFAYVRYYANIVPEDGPGTANGLLPRAAFNDLSVGGTATVELDMRSVDGGGSVGHLRVERSAPPGRPPEAVRVSRYSWAERVDEIRRGET